VPAFPPMSLPVRNSVVSERCSGMVKADLLIASFLALFMEVMFIRWVPSYERVLAYFTNFVLIAAFLGLGLGAMLARWRRDLMRYQPVLVLGLVAVALYFNQFVKTEAVAGDVFYSEFGREARFTLKLWQCLVFFFLLMAVEFVPLGQRIGKDLLAFRPPLPGYILNIVGSLLGVGAFALVSLLQLPPVWWFGGALGLLVWFSRADKRMFWANTVIAGLTTFVVWLAGANFIWSPYHKLVTTPLVVERASGMLEPYKQGMDSTALERLAPDLGFHIAVDDDFLQMALNLSPSAATRYGFLRNYKRQYDLPYEIPGFPYHDVLIVGAGTGNDTAAALRAGVQRVDAVEIDPALARLGRRRHPEQPYSDPRVNLVVDDARSYFNKTDQKYDVVVFGLLDSHRLFSSMSSVRLDSFVFTVESFQEVRRLLKPHGLAVVQHGLGAPFMGARMYRMLAEAFQAPPAVIAVPEFPGLTFIVGPGVPQFFASIPRVQAAGGENATDDWPFFYLEGRQLPAEYRLALLTMLLVTLVSIFGCAGGRLHSVNLHFFFLGSAFLLIETLSVTRFALLFGSTWMVNSIVFAAILVVVLLANLWMAKVENVNPHWLYALLGLSVLVNFWFPVRALLQTHLAIKLAAAVFLMGAPIFFAALIFAGSFKRTENPELAFASNLLGAVIGGLIEYCSMLIGFRRLLLLAVALYALSYLPVLRRGRGRAPTPSGSLP